MDTHLKKIIVSGDEAKKKLLRGIDAVADVVEPTLGPGGMNVIAEQTHYKPIITNDGVRVAKQALNDKSLDEVERIGAQLIVDTVSEEDKDAGDGTTTTTVLTRALAHKCLGLEKEGKTPMELKKQLAEESEKVSETIKQIAKQDFSLVDVANVSMEDEEHAKRIADIYERYGKDVTVTLKGDNKSPKVTVEEAQGYTFIGGYASPLFATDKSKMESVITNAVVYKFDEMIDVDDEEKNFYNVVLNKILSANAQKPIVIIAKDFDKSVVRTALANRAQNNIDITLVKRSQYKSAEVSEEISVYTGAGESFNNDSFDPSTGGVGVESITITDKRITIVNKKRQKEVDEFIETISDNEERLNRVKQAVVTIKVGGRTYSEMTYLRHKYEDAINACEGALEEGVVQGGGMCLKQINDELDDDSILKGILNKPFEIIRSNMGIHPDDIYGIPDKIIDSAKTVRSGVEHACTTASLLITTSTVIATVSGQDLDTDPSATDISELPIG